MTSGASYIYIVNAFANRSSLDSRESTLILKLRYVSIRNLERSCACKVISITKCLLFKSTLRKSLFCAWGDRAIVIARDVIPLDPGWVMQNAIQLDDKQLVWEVVSSVSSNRQRANSPRRFNSRCRIIARDVISADDKNWRLLVSFLSFFCVKYI